MKRLSFFLFLLLSFLFASVSSAQKKGAKLHAGPAFSSMAMSKNDTPNFPTSISLEGEIYGFRMSKIDLKVRILDGQSIFQNANGKGKPTFEATNFQNVDGSGKRKTPTQINRQANLSSGTLIQDLPNTGRLNTHTYKGSIDLKSPSNFQFAPGDRVVFQFCLVIRQDGAVESCAIRTVDFDESDFPDPEITTTPDISTSLKPRPPSGNEKTFDTEVTVDYDNFDSQDKVGFEIQSGVPNDWTVEANPAGQGWQDVTNPIEYDPGTGDGSFQIQYRVTVPLYEASQTKNFTADYQVVQ